MHPNAEKRRRSDVGAKAALISAANVMYARALKQEVEAGSACEIGGFSLRSRSQQTTSISCFYFRRPVQTLHFDFIILIVCCDVRAYSTSVLIFL